MKFISLMLQKLKPIPSPLGRWRTETCTIKMNHKIDLSNEDHCGHYALEKVKTNTDKK
jgi:hypothetical protein